MPGNAGPTVRSRLAPGRFIVAAVVHSVMPYPSRIVRPHAAKNSAISGANGAPPETAYRLLPPIRARTLPRRSRSASRACSATSGPPPLTWRVPTENAQLAILRLTGLPSAAAVLTAGGHLFAQP